MYEDQEVESGEDMGRLSIPTGPGIAQNLMYFMKPQIWMYIHRIKHKLTYTLWEMEDSPLCR